VLARIAAWLDEKVRRTAIRQYISILASGAEISGISFDANASPLVQ
jgi:peptidyl-prolyl cis-trans isomerase C